MKEIEQLKNHLERAYAEVSKLKVSGDAVDNVYEIREALRASYRAVQRVQEKLKEEAGDTSSTTGSAGGPPSPQAGKAMEGDRGEEVRANAAAEDEV